MTKERLRKIILYVVCTLDELVDEGALERLPGSQIKSKARGVAHFDQLKASGFRPTEEEVDAVIEKLAGCDPDIALLVKRRIAGEI